MSRLIDKEPNLRTKPMQVVCLGMSRYVASGERKVATWSNETQNGYLGVVLVTESLGISDIPYG